MPQKILVNLYKHQIMIDDLKKSFNEIVYERTTSPFYGTLITSWLIWNWKIIYLTFFVSEEKIENNKINYIVTNYSGIEHILIYPLVSTLFLLTLIPFLSNGAYWLSLNFNKWKSDQKNIIDKKRLLSVEQSLELREQISKQEERFSKLVEEKNLEIKQLNLQLNQYKEKAQNLNINTLQVNNNDDLELSMFAKRLVENQKELKQFENIIEYIQKGYSPAGKQDVQSKFLALLESYDIINRKNNGNYEITETGKRFYRLVNN